MFSIIVRNIFENLGRERKKITFTNALLYTLSSFHRKHLVGFERERTINKMDAHCFVAKRISNFELKFSFEPKKTYESDDGVDWFIQFNETLFVIQLKYFTKRRINRKYVKQIFGEMICNKVVLKKRMVGVQCVFLLLVPFASTEVQCMDLSLTPSPYHIFSNEKFVEFLINPYICIQNIIKEEGS
jgi:hypothetical protein